MKYSLSSCGDLLGLQPLGGGGEILDVGKEDRQPFALGVDGDVLLAAENALVDLRRQVARDLHRHRGEEFVGGFEFGVHGLDDRRLTPLQRDEDKADGRHQHEIGEQVFEGEEIVADRLGDGHFLQAAHVADLPVVLRAFRMGVVAGDARRAHHHRRDQAHLVRRKATWYSAEII